MRSPRSWGSDLDDSGSLTAAAGTTTLIGMKRVLLTLILALGCSNQSAPSPPGGGSGVPPIVGAGNTGGSGPDDGGVDGGIDGGIDGGVSTGACDNARDLVAITTAGGVRDTALACGSI